MKTIGEIGIMDIPEITRADLFKSTFPLIKELSEGIRGTEYMKESNLANRVATAIHISEESVSIYFSDEAKAEYGDQVTVALKYFGEIQKREELTHDVRMGILAWITDNIMNVEKMAESLTITLNSEEREDNGGEE